MSTSSPAHGPLAYLNGEIVPFAAAHLPVFDLGIMQGATVTERLRTVRHRPYLVREHLDRLERSLMAVGWKLPMEMGPVASIINDIAKENSHWIPDDADLAIVVFVTAGQSVLEANGLIKQSRPTLCIYTAPLAFQNWANSLQVGVHLITPQIRHLPASVMAPQIKHRSRLHWNVAEQEVRQQDPTAVALLLDEAGFVTETSTGNLFIVKEGQLLTPREEMTLAGISQGVVIRLAEANGLTVQRTDISVADLAAASEAFLTSSTYCMLPVSTINGERIGQQFPGPVTELLINAWNEKIGLNFVQQAINHGTIPVAELSTNE